MGAESKNWHLPVGALAAVWKDGGGDLKQQKGEQGLGAGTTDTGRRPCGTLDTCKFLGLWRRAGFSSEICVVLLLRWWETHVLSLLTFTPLLWPVPALVVHLCMWHLYAQALPQRLSVPERPVLGER